MKKVVVIGHLDWQGNSIIGAVVKARSIFKELRNQLGEESVGSVDIYGWKKRKIKVVLELLMAFAGYRNVVLVCSETSKILMRMFSGLKTVFHNKISYCVVGGVIAETLSKYPDRIHVVKCVDCFYVETMDCVEGLCELGLSAKLLRNFKCIRPLNYSDLELTKSEPYRFCTFSRVVEEKGITDAIIAVDTINKKYGRDVCCLDIYGLIEPGYKETFYRLLKEHRQAKYCGVVSAEESVEILRNYYCLLFPTKYQTEGIPGTIIDGFAAGLPVICSDWIRCRQLVEDGYNGLIYPFGSFDGLIEKMQFAVEHPENIRKLKANSLSSFSLYQAENAILPLISGLQ